MIIHLLKGIYTGCSYRIDIAQQNNNVFEDDLIKYSNSSLYNKVMSN